MLLSVIFAAPLSTDAGTTTHSQQEKTAAVAVDEKGFISLFNGKNLEGWQGATKGYIVEKGNLVCTTQGRGFFCTKKQYGDFILRFEYKLGLGGNNGVGIRAPAKGTPAYTGMEIQLLDDDAEEYKDLEPVQFTGAVYGAIACKRGHSKPAGSWNTMEIMAQGRAIRVTLNGVIITEGDLGKVGAKAIHGGKLEGLANAKGHIGFCGHAHRVEFRNVRILELHRNRSTAPAMAARSSCGTNGS
ncbi:MAG TPA: DUF1080 domain-containing protein [Planctomycetaceae bacterium]|nr:DUF1080 domain-containing protein [Planctomycetaceae bacterium]